MAQHESAPGAGDTRPPGTADLLAATRPDERDSGPPGSGPGDQKLFLPEEARRFRERWQAIQTGFVDDPQRAVREADELVAATIQSLAATFAEYRRGLEEQWSRGGAATEELRLVLRRYRSFFDQLLEH
ncbi:hypothetical protein [Qaidamihabitans albus]|uniref:hypothetical protein n=1 Tax=Qaidamihabitans albus TaxID=2795733 RepID=UPI0027DC42FD|nr:hypothetical protein [Qaidamihabitans albus]